MHRLIQIVILEYTDKIYTAWIYLQFKYFLPVDRQLA